MLVDGFKQALVLDTNQKGAANWRVVAIEQMQILRKEKKPRDVALLVVAGNSKKIHGWLGMEGKQVHAAPFVHV